MAWINKSVLFNYVSKQLESKTQRTMKNKIDLSSKPITRSVQCICVLKYSMLKWMIKKGHRAGVDIRGGKGRLWEFALFCIVLLESLWTTFNKLWSKSYVFQNKAKIMRKGALQQLQRVNKEQFKIKWLQTICNVKRASRQNENLTCFQQLKFLYSMYKIWGPFFDITWFDVT